MRRFGRIVPVALLALFAAACSGGGEGASPPGTPGSSGTPGSPTTDIVDRNLGDICDGGQGFPQAAAYAGTEHPMQVFEDRDIAGLTNIGTTWPDPWETWARSESHPEIQLIACIAEDQPAEDTFELCTFHTGPIPTRYSESVIRDLHERPKKVELYVARTGRRLADVVVPPPDDPRCPEVIAGDHQGPVFSEPREGVVMGDLDEYAHGPVR